MADLWMTCWDIDYIPVKFERYLFCLLFCSALSLLLIFHFVSYSFRYYHWNVISEYRSSHRPRDPHRSNDMHFSYFEALWFLRAAAKKPDPSQELEMMPLSLLTSCRYFWGRHYGLLEGIFPHSLLKTIPNMRILQPKSRKPYPFSYIPKPCR